MYFELDAIYERRQNSQARLENYKARTKAVYDKKVCQMSFQTGDLVLRQADALKSIKKTRGQLERAIRSSHCPEGKRI